MMRAAQSLAVLLLIVGAVTAQAEEVSVPADAAISEMAGVTAESNESSDADAKSDSEAPADYTSFDEVGRHFETLETQLEALDQSIKNLHEIHDIGQRALEEHGERLDAEITRIDPLALRLDALAERIGDTTKTLEAHDGQIQDNAVQFYDVLIRTDELSEATGELSTRVQRQEWRGNGRPAEEDEAGEGVEGEDLYLAIGLMLTLLVPVGIALILPSGPAATGAATTASRIAVAWAGGAAGFLLLGVTIMIGPSIGGLIGNPSALFAQVEEVDGEIVGVVIDASLVTTQMLLATVAALIVCAALPHGVPTSWRFLLAISVGAVLFPVVGHWLQAAPLEPGFLTLNGFLDAGAAVRVALVAGACALVLRARLGRAVPQTEPRDVEAPAGAFLLWGAWIGVAVLAAGSEVALIPLVQAVVTSAIGTITVLLLAARLFGAQSRWNTPLGLGALAGIVAGSGALDATTGEGMIIGALAAVFFLGARRLHHENDAAGDMIAATAAGGLVGALATGLIGEEGVLQSFGLHVLATQVIGAGMVVLLGAGAGALMAILLRRRPRLDDSPVGTVA